MIAFRRNLDPDCGLLSGESRFAASPSRLDAALRRTWGTYQRMRAGQLARCPFPPPLGGIIAEARPIGPSLVVPVSTVMPSILCFIQPNARCQPSGCSGLSIWANACETRGPHACPALACLQDVPGLRYLGERSQGDAYVASDYEPRLHLAK